MTSDIVKQNKIQLEQQGENKTKTAFLNVPIEIKDQVQAHIKELTASSKTDINTGNESIETLPDQGCFLVISLDKIEEIINELKNCLSMEPDQGARNIKSGIQRTLKLLN